MEEWNDDRFTASLSSERKIYQAAKQGREIHSEEASRATAEDIESLDADEPYECFRTWDLPNCGAEKGNPQWGLIGSRG